MIQQVYRLASKRALSSTMRQHAHFKEGPYSNLPFKVHNRKIPFGFIHFGFFAFGFALPFIACYVQFKKSGL